MAYITLEELKKILPGILSDWIWVDSERWEWIFQEIEQKCHVGKKKKDKKPKKKDMQNAMEIAIMAHRNDINELTKKIETLGDKYTKLVDRVNNMNRDINVAKSMAETAKQRTEVDYTQASKVKYNGIVDCAKEEMYVSEAQVAQNIYNRMVNRGATREELDSFREVIKKYDATSYSWNKEAKENE